MTTLDDARIIVSKFIEENYIIQRKSEQDDNLVVEQIFEFDDGWMFFLNSKIFLETHNILYRPLGIGPLIVAKSNGIVFQTSSGGTNDEYINEFKDHMTKLNNQQ